MLTCLDAISNGDVIAVQGRRYVVVAIDRSRCRAVPIFGASGTRHRADVPLEDRAAREACGLGDRAVVIACRAHVVLRLSGLARVGRVDATVMRRIHVALDRERRACLLETGEGLGSNLVALTASAGRRVGAVRYG